MTTVAAAGDIVLMRRLADADGALAAVLGAAGVALANLEVPLTDADTPVRGGLTLRAGAELVAELPRLGVDAVSLANNHAGDHGWASLERLARDLEARGVAALGIGRDEDAAFTPRLVEGVAVVAATCVAPAQFLAGLGRPGMAGLRVTTEWAQDAEREAWEPGWPPRSRTEVVPAAAERLYGAVREARELSPRVAVLMHWGVSHQARAEGYQRELARGLAGAGASVVFGCHAHTLQGVEVVDGVPVFHGLGSLVFQYDGAGAHTFARDAAVAIVDLDEAGRATSAELVVGRVGKDGEAVRAGAARVERVVEHLVAAGGDWGAPLEQDGDRVKLSLR